MDDSVYSDLLDNLSPLTKAGIDPDAARIDRSRTMAKLMGSPEQDVNAPPSWLDQAQAGQQTAAASPPSAPAAPPSTPAIPGSVTPTGNASTPSWSDLQRSNITAGMDSLDKADQALQAMQNQPDLGDQTAALEAKRTKDAQPLGAYDPMTGKLLDKYKPSYGQRLMRGVEGFYRGGVIGAVDPSIKGGTPYGAANPQYGRDVQQQAQQVNSDAQQLKDAATNWKAVSDRAAASAKELRAQGAGRQGLGTEINNQEKIPIQQQEADARTADAYNTSPQGKAEAAKELSSQTLASRSTQADQLKLSGTNRVLFMANGKIPDPRQATAEEVAQAQATRVFTQENGHPPQTLADYTKVRQAAKGEAGGVTMMVPDSNGGFTATVVRPGDNVPAGTTTAAGIAAAGKEVTKESKAAQAVVDEAELAHQAAAEADKGNAEGDVDLALSFFKTMKGSAGSGIRFTQAEQNLIKGARNSGGDLLAVGQKVVGGGQMFTPKQRADVLKIIDLHANAAKNHVGGGSSADAGGHDIVVNPEDIK